VNIKILPSAINDLADGWRFYEHQNPGLGNYFGDSLFSDIDSLALYGGIHRQTSGYFVLRRNDFPMPSTIECKETSPSSGAYWIVAVIPAGSGRNWNVIEPVVVRQRGEMLADLRFYFNFDLMFPLAREMVFYISPGSFSALILNFRMSAF